MPPALPLCWALNLNNRKFLVVHQNRSYMKNIFSLSAGLLLMICLFTGIDTRAQSQRYAIVDTRYILDKMPEYKEAQKSLDQISLAWQKEIDEKQAALDKMYRD